MKVGVVGLGFAGLRTASLLERAGVEVELFEARSRPGGRMHCIHDRQEPLYEAGGEWIDADHHRALKLIRDHGLEPSSQTNWPQLLIHRGKRTVEHLVWSDALEDDLRVEAVARELARGLRTPPWENQDAVELDSRRLGDFFREHTNSERGLWWVTAKNRSEEGEDPDRIGLLGWLSGYVHYVDRDGDVASVYRIPGGSSRLCDLMIRNLRAEPQYGAVLQRVRQSGDGVRLAFEDGLAEVDLAVLTLPTRCLERIVFEPALSVRKRCAIEACGASRAVKIAWQFDAPWWRDENWGGSMLNDGQIQQTWEASIGETPVLAAYVCGDQAGEWAMQRDPTVAALCELTETFPAARSHFVRGWFHNWPADPFSGGARSNLAPGYVLEHMSHIALPEGRVFFGGEHTSQWIGRLEGALESAERVAREVIAHG